MNSDSNGSNRATDACCGGPRRCAVYTFVLTFSTFTFVSSMLLTVYLTHKANMDMAVVVLIVSNCLLYLLGFIGNMYSIYCSKSSSGLSDNGASSNQLSQLMGASDQTSSTNARPPDILGFPRARELFRATPPPPYEVQMSEMSRMLNPGSSRTTEPPTREAEIAEEARKLIKSMYEEIKRTEQLVVRSSMDEQSEQQTEPKTPAKRHESRSPKVLHQNLVVQKQQTAVKSSSGNGIPSVGFRTNQAIQQKVAPSSATNQLDLGRFIVGNEGCSAAPLQLSPRFSGRLPADFRANQQKLTSNSPQTQPGFERFIIGSEECSSPLQLSPRILGNLSIDFQSNQVIQKKVAPNSHPNQPDLQKFVIDHEGCAVARSQPPHRRDILKVAHKRKLISPFREFQMKPKTKTNVSQMGSVCKDPPNNEYEEIEVVGGIQSSNSSHSTYEPVEFYSTENELEDLSAQASSATSAVSEPGADKMNRKFQTASVKERRLLSELTSRKFRKLGSSPETVLDAIATCFDLTPDEWMVAWKLSQKNVSPNERASILGVRLHEDSYNDDN